MTQFHLKSSVPVKPMNSSPHTKSSPAPITDDEMLRLRSTGATSAEVIRASAPADTETRALMVAARSRVPRRVVRLSDGRYVVSYGSDTVCFKHGVSYFDSTSKLYDAHPFVGFGRLDTDPFWPTTPKNARRMRVDRERIDFERSPPTVQRDRVIRLIRAVWDAVDDPMSVPINTTGAEALVAQTEARRAAKETDDHV